MGFFCRKAEEEKKRKERNKVEIVDSAGADKARRDELNQSNFRSRTVPRFGDFEYKFYLRDLLTPRRTSMTNINQLIYEPTASRNSLKQPSSLSTHPMQSPKSTLSGISDLQTST